MVPSILHVCFFLSCLVVFTPSKYSTSAVSFKDHTTTLLRAEADADRQALLCIKSQLSDPAGLLASWSNASVAICDWHGVTCSRNRQPSRVTSLDLEDAKISGIISPCLANLTFLDKINLPNNRLRGVIPTELRWLRRLRYLNLSTNSLNGDVPNSLGSIPSLVHVDLSRNGLTGQIPDFLANSSSLEVLQLSQNNFTGTIPPITKMVSSLKYLDLSRNGLSGTIPLSVGNLSSLSHLILAENNLVGSIPETLSNSQTLLELVLSTNKLSGLVPPSLYNITTLVNLDIRFNLLIGRLPDDIGNSLPNIQKLALVDNKFEGPIPASLSNASNIEVLYLAMNSFSGRIPLLGPLTNLTNVDLSINNLQAGDWAFLSSLTNCTQLVRLCLRSNDFEGNLPSSIGNLSTKLDTLWLNLNRISGTIPPEIGNLKGLTVLLLHDNMFAGNIPPVIGTLSNMTVLSLSKNKLSGTIPDTFGNLQQLNELYIRENELTGSIPKSLGNCKNLVMLNLSYNSLEGSIPSELLKISSLSQGLDFSHNNLTGHIPQEVGLINLGILSVSNNRLTGIIPSALGQCIVLESLHMEGNLFEGSIPQSFRNLRGIKQIDLSRNNLSGEIPVLFTSFTSLEYLNLSFNDFSGAIPATGVFANASEVSVQGNNRLCARAPMLGLPLCSENSKRNHKSLTLKVVIPLCAIAAISLSCFFAVLLKRRRTQPSLLDFREQAKVSYKDIVKATNRFSSTNLLGSGSFGTVYKGTLAFDLNQVAIKVFNLNFHGASRSFVAECEALRNIRHRNLVKIITSCCTMDPTGAEFKALIFQYMPNGSLDMWLHPKTHGYDQTKMLTFAQRINIAQDVAFAIDYLHNQCVCPLVHCDLKPENVLLDYDMTACVSDFGLAKFLCINSSSLTNGSTSLTGLKGSIGYIAPEYGMGGNISTEGDVHSFGVLLLEMLTGKRPTDDTFKNGMNLHNFVKSAFPDSIGDILDPIIMQECTENENQAALTMHCCIIPLIKVGLLCSLESPKDRPGMGLVSTEIHAINSSFQT